MYAVVNTGGKQAKVEIDEVVVVDKLKAKVGDTVSLPVLMIADGETVLATPAELAGASVSAEVLEHFKGEKQIVFKFKKRKGYKRTKGHRQQLTSVVIREILAEGVSKPAKAAKPKAEKAEKAAAPKKTEKAVAPKKAEKAEKAPVEAPAETVASKATQCAALKSDGTQCTNKAKEGSKYCGVHAKKLEG